MTNREVREHCRIDGESEKLLETAIKRINLSARSFFRILKVSRTIADLAGSGAIEKAHLMESLSYKNLYRLYNMQ
jgi:magnesium chelatase family protein